MIGWLTAPKGITGRQLQTSIRLGSFMLVLVSAVALLVTQRLLFSSMLLAAAAVIAWPMGKRAAYEKFWEFASLLYLVFFFFDAFSLSRGLAQALVHLFVFILINKLFNLKSTRDYYQLYLLSFLCMLAASSLSVEIEIFYLILIYIVLFLWNMAAMTLLREWMKQDAEDTFPFSLFHPLFWVSVLIGSVAAFVCAMGIFFILPRIQLGYFSNVRTQKTQHVSGFSQTVNLGDISSIEDNTGVAMRVRVTPGQNPPPKRFYWRGMGFDHYNGKSWSTTIAGTHFLTDNSLNFFYSIHYTGDPASLLKQEFYLEPMDTRVIFGQDRVVMLNGPFRAITKDSNQTLVGMSRLEHYEVFSKVNEFDPKRFDVLEGIPDNIRNYYLQLPPLSDEFHALSANLASKTARSPDRVLLVKSYLEENYYYTTENLPEDPKDPISQFLFKQKAGSCEYFATSMALLLRDMGIPTRLVTGYLQGEYNELSNFYLVRQTDAHAWVEVYLNGQWYSVDPSPRPQSVGGGSFFSLRKLVESISFFWDRYILIFSGQDQVDVVTSVRDQYRQIRKGFKSREETLPSLIEQKLVRFWKRYRLPLVGTVALIAISSAWLRFRRRRKKLLKLISTPVLFYQRTLTVLHEKGYPKPPQSTPSEFVKQIQPQIPAACVEDLTLLTNLFYQSRYGDHKLTESEIAAVKQSLQRLEQL